MTKAQRMLYGESAMTHAMVLTGVNVDVSKSYKIYENNFKPLNLFIRLEW